MTESRTYELVASIYSLFGRREPDRHSAIVATVARNTEHIPDSVMGYVYEKFKNLDTLPLNLTKAILGAWETWQMENPRSVYRETCPTCGGLGGFDCWALTEGGEDAPRRAGHFFAFCPSCSSRRREGLLYLTPRQWEARGVLVMPPGYPGGVLQFEADNGMRDAPEHDAAVVRSLRNLKLTMNHRTGYGRDYGVSV